MKWRLLRQILIMSKWAFTGIFLQALLCGVLLANDGEAQKVSLEDVYLTLQVDNVKLEDVFRKIEKETAFSFSYNSGIIDHHKRISADVQGESLATLLRLLSKEANLSFKRINDNIFVNLQKESEAPELIEVEEAPAQNIQIKGVVTSEEDGQPLPGVTILVDGTTIGTTTDFNGEYRLNDVPEDAVLLFSFIGFTTQQIEVGSRSEINVVMLLDAKELEEIVVVGYGTQKKADVTGSVSSVNAETLNSRPSTSAVEALSGRVAGVSVTTNSGRPGGNTRIRIRGYNSINSGNEPLFVIDGIAGASIDNVNPSEIESIEVLKDASATAIYGARGANGVVIVTTKRGEDGKARITYNNNFSIGTLARKVDVLNAAEYMEVERRSYDKSKDPLPAYDGKLFDENGKPLYDTDWQEETTRTAFSQRHDFGITGGNEQSRYGLFLGYLDQEGILLNSYFKRYNARFTLDNNVNDWLTVGGNLAINHTKDRRIDGNVGGLSELRQMLETLPIIPVKHPDGTWGSNADREGTEQGENPVRLLEETNDTRNTTRALGKIYGNIQFAPNLEFRTNFAVDLSNFKNNKYEGRGLHSISKDQRGRAQVTSGFATYWQFENYLTWKKRLNDAHNFTVMLGGSWQEYTTEQVYTKIEGFNDDFFLWNNLGAGASVQPSSSDKGRWAINSYFARVNYSLYDRYLLTVTGRYDGSSRFGKNNKFAFFPSAALAWKVSEEGFLKGSSAISDFKLRTSFGETGNTEIGLYQSMAALGERTVVFDGNRGIGVGQSRMPNPDLKWERTAQFDVGVDLGFLNDRIAVTFDYYIKTTKDLLLSSPVSYITGHGSVLQNMGSVRNSGIELMLNTRNLDGAFKWTTMVNFSKNKNEVLSLASDQSEIFPGPWFLGQTNVIRVGQPVGSFYGYIREGVWSQAEEELAAKYGAKPGDLKFKDLNNNGQIDGGDRTIIGNGLPDWEMNMVNTFSYKGFDLSIELQSMYGNDIFNLTQHSMLDRTTLANSYSDVLNAWTPENQNTDIASLRREGYRSELDTKKVEDGSFLRLKNISLSYNIPVEKINFVNISSLRVTFSAQNLWLLTDYSGYDPETTTYGDAFAQGIEFFQYPKPRTYNLGVSVQF
ncbi:SusC/RagA family TonB-linked outer membrane protein [Rapidithrix thailandica]|uniref:SusC/RagA family TonB-linked outer membrane protein n=1 Tax=Rapidithrix thailandica TaxID=413964 RepID=A0AAW9SEW1_9BACT